ncbi:hypothetical protein [Sediminitomix flava]|uniref:Uncharacterized protein n=1 Tax=Sediminitomix flava TaxID=379075 RepID=A0A315YY92_SEDFL|nr:hypothetical protein [Sediminitomix flava]PWJ35033.1 hypothetical protein BC781_11074 [Sediminitomix flava]
MIVHDLFDVEFVAQKADGSHRRLQVADTKNRALLKSALDKAQEGGSHYYPELIGESDEIYVSEAIFFAVALEYPALESLLFETAQAMAHLSRAHNDTSEMWVDDMRVFGVEALYMIARTYPKYSYLLAQFLIPYWDDEHAVGYEEYLASLLIINGWSEDMIKAFVWCDNHFFRQSMHSEDNLLGDYLKHHPEAYTFFKACLHERFETELVLLADEQEEEAQPLLEIYFSLLVSSEEWAESIEGNEALLEQKFIIDTLENEALDLENELKEKLQTSLIKRSESALKEEQFLKDIDELNDNYKFGDAYKEILSFFEHLPNGPKIREYIATGEPQDVLNSLPQMGLLQLAKTHRPNLYKQMCYYTSGYRDENELREELHQIISDLTVEHLSFESLLIDEEEQKINGLITRLRVRKENEKASPSVNEEEKRQLQERYLRILDVFYFAFGKKPFSDEIKEIIADPKNASLISLDEYYLRYANPSGLAQEQLLVKRKKEAVQTLLSTFYSETNLQKKNFSEAENLFTDRPLMDCSTWSTTKIGSYTLAAFLLYRDYTNGKTDQYTQQLFDFVQKGFSNTIASSVVAATTVSHFDDKQCPKEEQDKIHDYLTSESPKIDQAEAICLLRQYLRTGEGKYNASQDQISLFSYEDEYSERMLLTCFWLSLLPLPTQKLAKRIWSLLLDLAPQVCIKLVTNALTYFYFEIEFDDVLEEIAHYETLEKSGVPLAQSLAFQMVDCQSKLRREEDRYKNAYLSFLERYSDIDLETNSMFERIDKNRAIALDEGLHAINERKRITFFKHLALQNPRFPFKQEEIFNNVLKRVVKENLKGLEEQIIEKLDKKHILFHGYRNELPQSLIGPIVNDENTLTLPSTKINIHGLELLVLKQTEGNLHIVLQSEQFKSKDIQDINELYYMKVLILEDSIPTLRLTEIFSEKPTDQLRLTKTIAAITNYIEGNNSYDETRLIFEENITKSDFDNPKDPLSALALFEQFVWAMPEEKVDRILKLFVDHSHKTFDLFDAKLDEAYLERKVISGQLSFTDYLYARSDRDTNLEEAVHWIFQKLIDLNISTINLLEIMADYEQYQIGDLVVELTKNKAFSKALKSLNVEKRANIIEQLGKSPEGIEALKKLPKDSSRKIRDLIESLISK